MNRKEFLKTVAAVPLAIYAAPEGEAKVVPATYKSQVFESPARNPLGSGVTGVISCSGFLHASTGYFCCSG